MADNKPGLKTVMVVGSPRVFNPSDEGATYAALLEYGKAYRVINPQNAEQARQIIENGQCLDLIITGWEGSMKLLRQANRLQSGSMKNHGTKYVITGKGDAKGPLADRFRNLLRREGIEFTYLQQPDIGGLFRIVEELTTNPRIYPKFQNATARFIY